MILERGDVRPRAGQLLATRRTDPCQYPDAEKVLRGVLDENPSRSDARDACYWLAHHLTSRPGWCGSCARNPTK